MFWATHMARAVVRRIFSSSTSTSTSTSTMSVKKRTQRLTAPKKSFSALAALALALESLLKQNSTYAIAKNRFET